MNAWFGVRASLSVNSMNERERESESEILACANGFHPLG